VQNKTHIKSVNQQTLDHLQALLTWVCLCLGRDFV